MARRRADDDARDKIAVLGVETTIGADVRAELETRGVPGDAVDLYGVSAAEAVLSEYRGEARLIQPADPETLAAHRVVLVCAAGAVAEAVVARPADGQLVLDLAGVGRSELAHGTLRPLDPGATGVRGVPHPISLLLVDLLLPIARGPGIERAVATVLRPASDCGTPGIEELRGQVAGLLNFGELPKEVFGRRLAFNSLPQAGADERSAAIEDRAAADVRSLLGGSCGSIALRFVWVPVFFGHTLSIHVVPGGGATAADVAERLRGVDGIVSCASPEDCTADGDDADGRIVVATPGSDGSDGVWIWAVAADTGRASAREAMRLVAAAGWLGAQQRERT